MLMQAEEFLDHLVGVGLDSAELGSPPSLFEEVFQKAKTLGLKRVAHAGAPHTPMRKLYQSHPP